MANEERVRQNFLNGFVDVAFGAADTTLTSAMLANFPTISAKQHATITLDPRQEFGPAEIVYVTNHTYGEITATVLRGQEGTAARAHDVNVRWVHAPTKKDYRNYATRTYARLMWR